MAMSEKEIKLILGRLQDDVQRLDREVRDLRAGVFPGLSELKGMLRRRGLDPYRENPTQHLLFPPQLTPEERERFFHLFQRYSFRLFLREILSRKGIFRMAEVTRFSSPETGRNYLRILKDLRMAEASGRGRYRLIFLPTTSLGPTLEWFMAEILKRIFYCPVLYGLRCKGTRYGGDFEVLAAVEGRLLYMEVKSSPPKNIESMEVHEFISRLKDIAPHLALFFVDTELRLRDKIVPIFEAERRADGPEYALPIERIGEEVFFAPPKVYILGSKHSIAGNLAVCLKHHFMFSVDAREMRSPGMAYNP